MSISPLSNRSLPVVTPTTREGLADQAIAGLGSSGRTHAQRGSGGVPGSIDGFDRKSASAKNPSSDAGAATHAKKARTHHRAHQKKHAAHHGGAQPKANGSTISNALLGDVEKLLGDLLGKIEQFAEKLLGGLTEDQPDAAPASAGGTAPSPAGAGGSSGPSSTGSSGGPSPSAGTSAPATTTPSLVEPPAGAHVFNGLTSNTSQYRVVLGKGSQQHGIGGSGAIDGATVIKTGPDSVRYSQTGGKYGDSLIGVDVATPASDNHFQLKTAIKFDASYIKNGQMFEKDLVVTKPDHSHYVIGTQIDPRNGDVYFWDQKAWLAGQGGWVKQGSVTGGQPLQAGKDYQLEIDAHTTQGQYVYDNYSIDGKSVAMTRNAFSKTLQNWKPGMVVQTQADFNGKTAPDTTMSVELSNEQVASWA